MATVLALLSPDLASQIANRKSFYKEPRALGVMGVVGGWGRFFSGGGEALASIYALHVVLYALFLFSGLAF